MGINNKFQDNPDFASASRERIFRVLIIAFSLAYIFRLIHLQIIKGDIYLLESEAQAIKQEIVEPFRGNMYDRNGLLLVHNEPSFTVRLTRSDFPVDRIPLLSKILEMDSNEIIKTLETYKDYSKFEPIRIARDIEFKKVALLEEYNDLLPGVEVSVESKRLYDFHGLMSHLFGYTREISKEQLSEMPYYRPGDIVGKTGVENTYEEYLRGTKGKNFIAVNRAGQKVASFDRGKSDIPVNNGFDIYLTLDKHLQETAEAVMEGRRGAVIAIDPRNGEILAYISKPDFDLRRISGKIPVDLYNQLRDDPGHPLINRAIMSGYPPGSTWKMLVAIAGLSENVIDLGSTATCTGKFMFGGRAYGCHGHGTVNVVSAIKGSCNVFFYQLALKLGMDKLSKYAQMFGFGQKTFIDLPNENRGIFPTAEYLERKYGKGAASKGRLINYGIGQGEINVTPVQMAVYVSALASYGLINTPHLVRSFYNNLTGKIKNFDYGSKQLPIKREVFDVIHKGMFEVCNMGGGTATGVFSSFRSNLANYQVYGKTGTAQNPHGKDHSWFVCFATEKGVPKIAIVTVVENAGFGATVAAPICFKLLSTYLNPKSIDIPIPDEVTDVNEAAASSNPND